MEDLEKLRNMIQNIKVAMLNTIDAEGCFHGRPMASQEIDSQGNIWFLSAVSSHKVTELNKTHRVQLNYISNNDNHYVSISGTGEVFHDRKKAEELWSPLYQAWFPRGLDDPDLICIKVHIEEAEHWDASTKSMHRLYGFEKAGLTSEMNRSDQKTPRKIG